MNHKTYSVKTGLDRLVAEDFKTLKNKRLGLLAHPASVDSQYRHLLDLCMQKGLMVKKLFGPEHGMLGQAQDMESIGSTLDPQYGLPSISLYGSDFDSILMKAKDLEDIDILVCDLQDIGSRYYTFATTLAYAMKACAESDTKCLVLDRPNPIGGTQLEGNLTQEAYYSFVGQYPLPARHGQTLGELAHFYNKQHVVACDLEVITLEGWSREMHLSDLENYPWIPPSPNMPTYETALVYPGACLFEGTNLSEGRGTTRPFECVGAPFIDRPDKLAQAAMDFGLDGVILRPIWFQPNFHKHAHKLCGGVHIHVTDRSRFNALKTGLAIMEAARGFDGFEWRTETYEFVSDRLAIDLLLGDDAPRKALEAGSGFSTVWKRFFDIPHPTLKAYPCFE